MESMSKTWGWFFLTFYRKAQTVSSQCCCSHSGEIGDRKCSKNSNFGWAFQRPSNLFLSAFYIASEKICPSGVSVSARHHCADRWGWLPQLSWPAVQFPGAFQYCCWYRAFGQQWRKPWDWWLWKIFPRIQWRDTPLLCDKWHTSHHQSFRKQWLGYKHDEPCHK